LRAVSVVPYTVAFSAVDSPTVSDVEVGLRATDIVGIRAIVALAVLVGSNVLIAVNMTFCELVSDIGTV
jgi:hypothetical protein